MKSKRNKQRKSLIKKVLIGVGIAGVSILTVRAIIHGRLKRNECQNRRVVCEPVVKIIEKPTKKEVHKPIINGDAVLSQCNKLLKTLWKSNPTCKLYFDDEICVDIKNCPFPPYILRE